MIQDPYKEDAITNYIKSIDFNSDFNVNEMKRSLKMILGEEPAVKLEWTADTIINEVSGKKEGRVEKLMSVKVFYSTLVGEVKKVELFI